MSHRESRQPVEGYHPSPPCLPPSYEPSLAGALWRGARHWLATRRGRLVVIGAVVIGAAAVAVATELRTSRLQAAVFTDVSRGAWFELGEGPSPSIRFPGRGPYDLRLGYATLPQLLGRLDQLGYRVDRQARGSARLLGLIDHGIFPLYPEKTQAGLQILARDHGKLFTARYPARTYPAFDDIPPLVVQTLLFLENRELLDPETPYRNPAIEWDRTLRAALHLGARQIDPTFPGMGGSTLATQLEKMRHSPGGLTGSVTDKLRQIATATLRGYLGGPETLEAQRRIVTAYLNSIPLAAIRGHGEVIGLGDGLWAWYGTDFDRANQRLRRVATAHGHHDAETARAYRQVVSLLVAIRRPSDYLVRDPDRLAARTTDVLRALGAGRIVSPQLAESAIRERTALQQAVSHPRVSFVERKPANAVRSSLTAELGLSSVYTLDRLDLTVHATLDRAVQQRVSDELGRLADPDYAAGAGLAGDRLLRGVDPASVIYSLVLYERTGDANLIRVHADSLDQPLDVTTSTKLELGSTAKLRTLVSYLEIVAALHDTHRGQSATRLSQELAAAQDPLTRWTLDQLRRHPEVGLDELLERAIERSYSASPHERFVTGGGVHRFANFDADDNSRGLSVRAAFRASVNLVFIRLMRDIVRYHTVRLPDWSPTLLDDRTHPARVHLLQRFADREGISFLDRFRSRVQDRSPEEAVEALARRRPTRPRLAAIHRTVYPGATAEELARFLDSYLDAPTSPATVEKLHEENSIERWSLADRGYLAGVHPLELWLVADLVEHGHGPRAQQIARSVTARQQAYAWLFRTRHQSAQDRRIRTELERDAFVEIHRSWQRLGYPFGRLVPSFATAIGSSGDNPAALAELMGIIQNRGRRLPLRNVIGLRFAEATPFETWLSPRPARAHVVLNSAVADLLKRELLGVVEHGTGRRLSGAVTLTDSTALLVGGKTGTGDNRVETPTGSTRRVLNRTATFTFLIGDRFFGTLTAYVDGGQAARYRFTSALPVQVLKHLVPVLRPLLETPAGCAHAVDVGCSSALSLSTPGYPG